MIKAYRYQLYPTSEQRNSFNLGIIATSIYYNMILEFYVTAFKLHNEYKYLSIKALEDKSKYINVVKAIAEKRDKNDELIKHNEWARQLLNDTEYHPTLFYKRDKTPKGNWVDIAEACVTYAIKYHQQQFNDGIVDVQHPIAGFERGAMQMARENVKTAVKKFWQTRTKSAPFKGFPKFKSRKNSNNSYTYSPVFKINFDFDRRKISYKSKKWNIGDIKIGKGRIPPKHAIYRSSTISRSSTNKYYISVLIEDQIDIPELVKVNNIIGIDIGLKDKYCALSDETIIKSPKVLKNNLNKLIHAQRKACRKICRDTTNKPLPMEKQSKNYIKALNDINRIHEKIYNIRNTFLHTLTSQLVNSNVDAISIETLSVKNMMIKNDDKISNYQMNNINRAYADAAIYTFIMQLDYKCKWKGKHLVKVDKYFASSQICSCCGYKNTAVKDLSIRNWVCPNCMTQHDRDINAAINIKDEGIKLLNKK